jgi:hypothetical protein
LAREQVEWLNVIADAHHQMRIPGDTAASAQRAIQVLDPSEKEIARADRYSYL